jgi:hypothetical protein
MSMLASPSLLLQLTGLASLKYVLMAFRMSMYRLAHSKSGKYPQAAEDHYENQMLNAEWLAPQVALYLGLYLKFVVGGAGSAASPVPGFSWLQLATAASATLFSARTLFHAYKLTGLPQLVGIGSMVASYTSAGVAAGILAFA